MLYYTLLCSRILTFVFITQIEVTSMYISTLHFDKRSMYTHVSTSCKQLRCHYAAYCGLSVVCLVPFIGLRPHESSSLSRTARYTWLGRSRCSLCLVLLTACQLKLVASRSLTSSPSSLSLRSASLHAVPAIMVAGKCTKRTTAAGH